MKASKRSVKNRSSERKGRAPESHPLSPWAPLLHAALVWLVLLTLASWLQRGDWTAWVGQAAWVAMLFGVSAALTWLVFFRRSLSPLKVAPGRRWEGVAILGIGFALYIGLFATWIASGEMSVSTSWRQQLLAGTAVASPILFSGATQQAFALSATNFSTTNAWNARRLQLGEIALLLLFSLMAFPLLSAALGADSSDGGAAQRWMWMATALAIGAALFLGQMALQALRRPGAAMLIFAAALFYQALVNFGYARAHGESGPGAAVHLLALAAAAAMDVMYMLRLPDADSKASLRSALGVATLAAFTLAAFFRMQMFGVPSLDPPLALVGLGAGAVLGLWCGWRGAEIGRWLAASAHLCRQNVAKKRKQP